jgi:hypothetical protein
MTSVGIATVASDGSYGLTVPLVEGDNVLMAREVDNCSNTKDSSSVTIHRTVVTSPQPPAGSGSSVTPPSITPSPSSETIPSTLSNPPSAAPVPNTPGYQKPTVTSPTPGQVVTSSHLWVRGSAKPGSRVTIYANGLVAGEVLASDDGTYAVMVTLRPGENTIQVRARLGGDVATSESVNVLYVPPRVPVLATSSLLSSIGVAIGIFSGGFGILMLAGWCISPIRRKLKRKLW